MGSIEVSVGLGSPETPSLGGAGHEPGEGARVRVCLCTHAPVYAATTRPPSGVPGDNGRSAAHSSTICWSATQSALALQGVSQLVCLSLCLVADNLSAQESLTPLVNWTCQRQMVLAAPSVREHGWATMLSFVHWPASQYAPSAFLLVSPPVRQLQ